MNFKKYKNISEKKPIDYAYGDDVNDGFDDIGSDDDALYGRPYYYSSDDEAEDITNYDKKSMKFSNNLDDYEDDVDDTQSDDMQHLLYLLRTLFKNSGIDASLENKGLDIIVCVVLNKKEKLSSIIKVFDVAKKLQKDILPQYDAEFEMWETKTRDPMLTFNFMYEGDDEDPNRDGNAPF